MLNLLTESAQVIGANIAPMGSFDSLGKALRALRARAKLDQVEVSARAGISNSIVNRAELGKSLPSLSSLDAILRASGATLLDLAVAMEEVETGPRPAAGVARRSWVAALVQRGVTPAVLAGIAIGTVGDDAAPADLVASAEAAAAELARAAVQEVRESSSRLGLVAEPTTNYGEGKKR